MSGRSDRMEQQGAAGAADLMTTLREYARQNPETAALWCFAVGFILGWRLKPW